MAGDWSPWRAFATGLIRRPGKKPGFVHNVNPQSFKPLHDDPGPGCYKLGIKPKGATGQPRSVYIGMTGSLYERIHRHADRDRATAYFITNCLRHNPPYLVYLSYIRANTEGEAEKMEEEALAEWWRFPWNAAGTPSRPKKS